MVRLVQLTPRKHVTSDDLALPWVDEIRGVGIFITRNRRFKCSFANSISSFYRSVNAIFGKVLSTATVDAILHLINSTPWAIKKRHFYFFDNSDKYWQSFVIFFTAIYNNELRNKNLLQLSPHLKSVVALPCETWNVKCVDIQQGHIQFKTDSKCQVTVLSLRLWRFVHCCATHSTGADTARRRHLRVSRRPALALQPRSYNPRGSYLGCLRATGREK